MTTRVSPLRVGMLMKGHQRPWRQRVGDFMERMSGRLTPPEITPMDGIQNILLPIADLFMIVMFSRPPGGSLRTARVTLATIALGAAVAVLAGFAEVALVGGATAQRQYVFIPIALLDGAFGLGAAVLTLFGVRQRILIAAQQRSSSGRPSPAPPQRGGEK